MEKTQWSNRVLRLVNIVFMILAVIGIVVTIYDAAQSPKGIKSGFTSEYDKERHLFKSLNPNEQAEYLALSRDQKFIKYGTYLK